MSGSGVTENRSAGRTAGSTGAGIAAFCALAFIFLSLTRIIPAWGEWYSEFLAYRHQTNALLNGHFQISPNPYAGFHDWAWGNGMQQVWGMGVPFLRLPFEGLFRLFSWGAFPDRLVLLLVWFLSVFSVWRLSSEIVNRHFTSFSNVWRSVAYLAGSAFFFLSPGLLGLLTTRLAEYEEAIAYLCLFVILQLSLLGLFILRPRSWLLLLICFVSGFSLLIRPSALFFALPTVLGGLIYARILRYRFPQLLLGVLCFGVFVVILLSSNAIRFGSPFEFGYLLNVTGSPEIEYLSKFYYPLGHQNGFSIFKGLSQVWSGFSNPPLDSIGSLAVEMDGENAKVTEFYFQTSGLLDLIIPSVLILICALVPRARKGSFSPLLTMAGLWILTVLIGLFIFYARIPVLTSRYLAEFSPVFSAVAYVAFWVALHRLQIQKMKWNLGLAVLVLTACFPITRAILSSGIPSNQPISSAQLEQIMTPAQRMLSLSGKTPAAYECGKNKYNGILDNLSGWNSNGDCRVSITTAIIIRGGPCVTLNLKWEGDSQQKQETLDIFEARMDLEFLKLHARTETGDQIELKLCDDHHQPSLSEQSATIHYVSLKWGSLAWLKGHLGSKLPLRLESIHSSQL